MWYSPLYFLFILLKTLSSTSIHATAKDETSLCYDAVIMCRDIKSPFIHWWALGMFYVLAIVNISIVSVWVQESEMHIPVPLDK